MANYTANYDLVKPTMAESADIRTINGNMDTIDDIMHATQVSLANAYDQNETYNTGDIVMYEFLMYECLDDEVTGAWDATKWQRTTAGEHGGGGGGSDVEITPTLQSGTKIADFEIDGVSGALYAPSGGGGGGGGSDSKIVDTLWEGTLTAPTTGTDVTLSHNYTDYDVIVVTLGSSGYPYQQVEMYQTDSIVQGQLYVATGWYSQNTVAVVAYLIFNSETSINLKSVASSTPTTYYKIQGIKFGGMLAPMIYSTEEREVGVWVDNKPLYQKSYLLNTPIEITNNGLVISSYIDNYQDIECFVRGQASYTESSYGKQGADIWVGYSSADLMAYCSEGCMANVITLLYTKDSDVAGSGSYGSLGVPMEHYDGEERVVGTYFGETLYQKTFSATIDSTATYIPTGVNIREMVDLEACGSKTSGGTIVRFGSAYNDGGDRLNVQGANNDIRILCTSWFVGGSIKVTLKYTKSTT